MLQITIDITPPHAGVVHDGLPGNPEIDYQQEYVLNVYWDQFFDRESGVYFYQYIVGPSCENKHSFDIDLTTNPNVSKKLKTFNITEDRQNKNKTHNRKKISNVNPIKHQM